MKKKSRFLQTRIEPFIVESGLTSDQMIARMERISFQGRNLATAHRIWHKMLEDDVTIFLGMAGALSAGSRDPAERIGATGTERHNDEQHANGDRIRPTLPEIHATASTRRHRQVRRV